MDDGLLVPGKADGIGIFQGKEEGLLSLEDNLSLFIPHLPEWANTIKVKNLLQYSSGLPKIDWDSYFQSYYRPEA